MTAILCIPFRVVFHIEFYTKVVFDVLYQENWWRGIEVPPTTYKRRSNQQEQQKHNQTHILVELQGESVGLHQNLVCERIHDYYIIRNSFHRHQTDPYKSVAIF